MTAASSTESGSTNDIPTTPATTTPTTIRATLPAPAKPTTDPPAHSLFPATPTPNPTAPSLAQLKRDAAARKKTSIRQPNLLNARTREGQPRAPVVRAGARREGPAARLAARQEEAPAGRVAAAAGGDEAGARDAGRGGEVAGGHEQDRRDGAGAGGPGAVSAGGVWLMEDRDSGYHHGVLVFQKA